MTTVADAPYGRDKPGRLAMQSLPNSGVLAAEGGECVRRRGAARGDDVTVHAALAWLRRAAAVLRALLGAPDYDRYLAHVRRHHPGAAPLSREDFVRQRLEARYSRPGSRCC